MKRRQRSKTAEATAAVRARHLLYEKPVIFEDPFAIHLTSRVWRTICKSRILDWIICRKILGNLGPIQAQILARSRYAEDQLEKAMAVGIDQYVLLGAGLDSFVLRRRDLATTLRVYELDHPTSQQTKIHRLRQLRIDLPENLEFVAADLEEESVAEALARSTYIRRRPAFYSWLGTVHYLTRDAVFGTLGSIASLAVPGSEIVFDYRIPKTLVDPIDLPTYERIERFTARRGEPMIASFDPRTFPQEVCKLGFKLFENVSPEEQEARYFAGREDDLRPTPYSYFAHFQL